MPIYVNTDKKLFSAGGLSNAPAVEQKMKEVVVQTITDDAGADFNTDKPGKGYSLRMKVVAEKSGRATKYSVNIEILRYPPEKAKGKKGEFMVPITASLGSATLEGASEADLIDAIGQLTKSNVKAAIAPMRIDMTRR
jgi:hypothetical protein